MEAIAAYDAGQAARSQGLRSTADWLTTTTGMAHAGAVVHTARALRDELPATAAALATGPTACSATTSQPSRRPW